MNFLVFNLDDGSKKPCHITELSKSLAPNCEILREVGDSYEAIGFVSHSLLVYFCAEFAEYALQNYAKKKIPEVEECLSIVRKWIESPNSVSSKELISAAAYAAYAAAYAADYAAADAAAYAAADAAAAAAAYAYAAGKDRQKEFERQGNFVLEYFLDSSNVF
jgi:hypothetical protein